jgi:hypothetical protein
VVDASAEAYASSLALPILVAVGLGGDRQTQGRRIVAVGADREVVERDDPRQAGHAADEGAEVVVGAAGDDGNRQLHVELAAHLGLQVDRADLRPFCRPLLVMSSSRPGTSVSDGSWLISAPKDSSISTIWLTVGIEVGDLEGFFLILLLERRFLGLHRRQLLLQVLDVVVVAAREHQPRRAAWRRE